MKPCRTIQYTEEWMLANQKSIAIHQDNDDFLTYLNKPFDALEKEIKIATSVKVNGFNQSFISIAKEKEPYAIAHCEFFISPIVAAWYHRFYSFKESENLITLSLSYMLQTWFDKDNLKDAYLLSYWGLAPGPVSMSSVRKQHIKEGYYDALLYEYRQRHCIAFDKYTYAVNKLRIDGIGPYLHLLDPHPHLEYQHVMDVIIYYIYEDVKRCAELMMLYFPYSVIKAIIKQ